MHLPRRCPAPPGRRRSIKTSARFASLAWGCAVQPKSTLPWGLIAGGVGDGLIQVFDAHSLYHGGGEAALLAYPRPFKWH